jgi:hypothetical protein
MPSMHVGWALWCTMAIISITRALWLRVSAVLYVVVTTLVVVATANHWILDAIVGAGITAGVWFAVNRASRSKSDDESSGVPEQGKSSPEGDDQVAEPGELVPVAS